MAYELNSKLSALTPYDPIIEQYRIRLDANESFFDLNDDVKKKIYDAVSVVPFNRYPDPYATEAVKAFAELYGVDENYVTAGNGSDELISIITSCFLEKGDRILVLKPDFSMYAFYGSLYETEVEVLEKNEDLTVDVDKIILCCNEKKIKAVVFSNPCNPTSVGVCRDDVLRLISSVESLVILDEAYMDFWSESVLDRVGDFDNLIILKTCSKAVGIAAVRLGFAVAGKKITSALRAAKSPYNCDSISQAVGKVVLSEKEMLNNNLGEILKSRDYLYSKIKKLSGKYSVIENVYPTVTNFVFIKTDRAEEIFRELLKRSVAIRYMGAYLRITAGSTKENDELLKNIEEILDNLK